MSRRQTDFRKAAISVLYMWLFAAVFLIHGVHEGLIGILLAAHCYTDCRDGTVYCMPTYICIAVEVIVYIIRLVCGAAGLAGLTELAVSICGIIFFSRIIHAYAEGDEEIYVMLVLAAANEGKDALFYGIHILGCSGSIFVLSRLCLMAGGALLRGRQGMNGIAMEAPMLPAILGAYILAL